MKNGLMWKARIISGTISSKKELIKSLIMNYSERLTQPGKIALVYFDERDNRRLWNYIKPLQDENLLMNHLEELELEC